MEETWRSKLSPPAVPIWVLLVSTYVKLPDATADGLAVGTVAEEVDLPTGEADGEAVCPLQAINASALTTMAVSRHVDFTV
jgi:hypothetical protein